MNTNIKINSVQEFNQFMRNMISHFENKGSKPINRKSTSTAMKTKKIESKAEIIAEFRKTARRFNSMSNSSHPSEERNRSGYDPNKVKLAREKKVVSEPKQTSVNPRQTQKEQIRAGKAYGTNQNRSGSGYNPSKAKLLREETKRSSQNFENGPGHSHISANSSSKGDEGYNPAKVREARALRKMNEDDNYSDLKMGYSTTGRR